MLLVWQRYRTLYGQCVTAVQKQEKHADQLLKSATDKEITEEENNAWMKDCNVSGDRNIQGFFLSSLTAEFFKCFPFVAVGIMLLSFSPAP